MAAPTGLECCFAEMTKPEERARLEIDAALGLAGWVIPRAATK